MKKITLIFSILILAFCQDSDAQYREVEKEVFRYHKTKTLEWANKQNPDNVELLYVKDYQDEYFPNEAILKFKNLKHLIVEGREMKLSLKSEVMDPHLVKIDLEKLKQLQQLEHLQLRKFDFRTFPKALTNVDNLKTLSVNNCLVKSIPSEIGNMTNLEGLFLRQNQLKSLPLELKSLSKLKVLDLTNNNFSSLDPVLLSLNQVESLYIGNYLGVNKKAFSIEWPVELQVNEINFLDQLKLLKVILQNEKTKQVHIQVANAKIKRTIKDQLSNKKLAKKIVWQSFDCGCD